jgi:hypothetical protein
MTAEAATILLRHHLMRPCAGCTNDCDREHDFSTECRVADALRALDALTMKGDAR